MLARRRSLCALALAVGSVAARGDAAVVLRITAAAAPADAPGVELTAENAGDEPALDVTAAAVSQHATATGDAVRVDPGGRHTWRLSLPPPPDGETVPAIARVRYATPDGSRGSLPAVALLSAPGASPPALRATLVAEPLARVSSMRLELDNTGGAPVAGRVVAVLPGVITTEPESQAAAVGAHAAETVVIMLDGSQARADAAYPAYALFEYTDGNARRTVVATTELRAATDRSGGWPLVVGGVATLAALALLGFALVRSRR